MRFRTRAFLICFIPFALLLTCGFALMQRFVLTGVRDGLRASLRENQLAIARAHAHSDLQNSRFLKVAGENAALKAGMQLLSESRSAAARSTVEDQLRELGEHMGFDFLRVSAPDGTPLAGVLRRDGNLVPMETSLLTRANSGVILIDGRALELGSVPIDAAENIGLLSVGAEFNFAGFTTPAVLLRNRQAVESNLPDVPLADLRAAMRGCGGEGECELNLRGARWISVPVESQSLGDGFELRILADVDAATGPLASVLHNMFLWVAVSSVLVAFLCALLSSRSIVRPLASVVEQLRGSAQTGMLPEIDTGLSRVVEIRELVVNYNHAAVSARDARENLQNAYIEFVGSLANALDARDPYTAGHSKRVSDLASATAAAMGLPPADIERIRTGALLHDIGKIGVADNVLQKAGRLTDEEFVLVKKHPVIGRRILEGVQGLSPFVPAVELHHENWDGSGYPRGQSGEQTPVDARIIHIADAYDAMTTDRSYRRGLTHRRALAILQEYAGTQFDPHIVPVFVNLPREILIPARAITDAPIDSSTLTAQLSPAELA
jgi:putative nucleotidyltransferase with HDIG domain